jgi:hypothetical protein
MKTLHWLLTLICILTLTAMVFAEEVGIYKVSTEARDLLVEMKSTVRHGQTDGWYTAELSPSEVNNLIRSGFAVELLYESAAAEAHARRLIDGTDEFHSYDQIRDGFYALAAAYPGFTVLEHLGYSVQNRELFALKITANPLIEENEPEIVFWGCIHGNEYAAAEVPYLYAIYLCENYGVDPDITEWIDNNEIWCIPVINPDGRVNGSRNNANGIDLNRDLGYQWDGWGSSWFPFSQVETRAVREFCMDNNVTLSTTHHCSGDVLFYQYGYSPQDAPDDNLIVRVGERYASAASYALINSWEDYETHGEVLDYVYGSHGALCYTVEISNSSSQMQYTYERNQAGMNAICGLAGEGIHGTVTDAQTSEPLRAAVWIDGNSIPSYTDPTVGDLHRLLLPGTYDLTVWANGYLPQTIENVAVAYGIPGQFEAQLEPGGGEYAFAVTSVNQEDPDNDYQNATTPAWALGEPDNFPCSIGANGFIVLDMGEGHEIADGPGDDFTITEWDHPRDPGPESYRVYAGDAYVQDVLIGQATGTASFDLNGSGVTSTRYLKILDASGSSPSFPLAGMDLDAATILNSTVFDAGFPLAEISIPTGIELSAYPNPFNPVTTFSFTLPKAQEVSLTVYDVRGRQVAELVSGWWDEGEHKVTFDGSNQASGIYVYRLEAGGYTNSGKMVLMK